MTTAVDVDTATLDVVPIVVDVEESTSADVEDAEESSALVVVVGDCVTLMSASVDVCVGNNMFDVTIDCTTPDEEESLVVGVAVASAGVVVAAILDKALASDEAAEATSPEVAEGAALLRADCRLDT